MAFNKKNKRKITVGGQKYFWKTKGNDDWISLTVMTDIEGSSRLLCNFDYHQIPVNFENKNGFKFTALTDQFVITPFTVRQVIEFALSQGWNPFEKGTDINLFKIDDKIDLKLDKYRTGNFKKDA